MKFRVGRLEFEWDEAKADSNTEKHGVAFEDAATVFMDGAAKSYYVRTIPTLKIVISRSDSLVVAAC